MYFFFQILPWAYNIFVILLSFVSLESLLAVSYLPSSNVDRLLTCGRLRVEERTVQHSIKDTHLLIYEWMYFEYGCRNLCSPLLSFLLISVFKSLFFKCWLVSFKVLIYIGNILLYFMLTTLVTVWLPEFQIASHRNVFDCRGVVLPIHSFPLAGFRVRAQWPIIHIDS